MNQLYKLLAAIYTAMTIWLSEYKKYWLQCHTLAGATPYEIVVRSAEFLAAALQIHPPPEGKLRELAESSDW